MPATYAQNKQHIYKWRQSNLDKVRDINRKSNARYVAWKKIQMVFLSILLE